MSDLAKRLRFRASACPDAMASSFMREAAAVLEARDRDAARWRWDRDAARWRWARADKILWSGTYDYGVISPEDADAIADATVVQGDPALDSKPNLP